MRTNGAMNQAICWVATANPRQIARAVPARPSRPASVRWPWPGTRPLSTGFRPPPSYHHQREAIRTAVTPETEYPNMIGRPTVNRTAMALQVRGSKKYVTTQVAPKARTSAIMTDCTPPVRGMNRA